MLSSDAVIAMINVMVAVMGVMSDYPHVIVYLMFRRSNCL